MLSEPSGFGVLARCWTSGSYNNITPNLGKRRARIMLWRQFSLKYKGKRGDGQVSTALAPRNSEAFVNPSMVFFSQDMSPPHRLPAELEEVIVIQFYCTKTQRHVAKARQQ